MLDIGNNLGMERDCWCGVQGSSEHILVCNKVMEEIDKSGKKEWLAGERRKDLMKAAEYMKHI